MPQNQTASQILAGWTPLKGAGILREEERGSQLRLSTMGVMDLADLEAALDSAKEDLAREEVDPEIWRRWQIRLPIIENRLGFLDREGSQTVLWNKLRTCQALVNR